MTSNFLSFLIVVGFMMVALFIGLRGYRVTQRTAEDYFLASRSLGTAVLLLTMFATLMSSFTFFGGPGNVYATGMEWMLVMGLMDGFLVALLWYVVGARQWRVGRRHRYITVGEMLGDRFNSTVLRVLVAVVSLFWLFPYVMMQQMGAGYALSGLTGGAIPFGVGAGLITAFMIIYVALGGMRGVAWTDTFQGLVMLVCVWVALIVIGRSAGGVNAAGARVMEEAPRVFTLGDPWTPQAMWSAAIGTALGVISFPQINQRFFVGRSSAVLRRAFILWPILCLLLFLPAFLIGAWGAGLVPGLEKPDTVLSVMLGDFAPWWFASIVISGALAAMMSSSDSMLLSAGSYLTHDVYKRLVDPGADARRENLVGRVMVVTFALVAYLFSLRSPGSLVAIGLLAFGGFAQLTPVLLVSLYWKRATGVAMILAVVLSEGFYLLSKFTPLLPGTYAGWDASMVGVVLATVVLVGVSAVTAPRDGERPEVFFGTSGN